MSIFQECETLTSKSEGGELGPKAGRGLYSEWVPGGRLPAGYLLALGFRSLQVPVLF